VAFATSQPFSPSRRLRLMVSSTLHPDASTPLSVYLDRTSSQRVPMQQDVRVTVELQERTAVVTVGQVTRDESVQKKLTVTLNISFLSVALLSEGYALAAKEPEIFTATLRSIELKSVNHPSRKRDMDFTIGDLQVDLRRPEEVVLASLSRPFLRIVTRRDDTAMFDMHYRQVQLVLSELEVSITDKVVEKVTQFVRDMSPGQDGLRVEDVMAGAAKPYHSKLSGPPSASKNWWFGGSA